MNTEELAQVVKEIHRTIAGLQFAILAMVEATDDPSRMISSLASMKTKVLPNVSPGDSNYEIKVAVIEQLDMMIQHIDETRIKEV